MTTAAIPAPAVLHLTCRIPSPRVLPGTPVTRCNTRTSTNVAWKA